MFELNLERTNLSRIQEQILKLILRTFYYIIDIEIVQRYILSILKLTLYRHIHFIKHSFCIQHSSVPLQLSFVKLLINSSFYINFSVYSFLDFETSLVQNERVAGTLTLQIFTFN